MALVQSKKNRIVYQQEIEDEFTFLHLLLKANPICPNAACILNSSFPFFFAKTR